MLDNINLICSNSFHVKELYSIVLFGEVYSQIYDRNIFLFYGDMAAIKQDFRQYIRQYTSPNVNIEYVIPI